MDKKKDRRAIDVNFLNKLKEGGELYAFTQLVRNYIGELILCFRGNFIEIYNNNRCIFIIKKCGTISISFNHARYSEPWESYLSDLKKYGFKQNKKSNEIVLKKIDILMNNAH